MLRVLCKYICFQILLDFYHTYIYLGGRWCATVHINEGLRTTFRNQFFSSNLVRFREIKSTGFVHCLLHTDPLHCPNDCATFIMTYRNYCTMTSQSYYFLQQILNKEKMGIYYCNSAGALK